MKNLLIILIALFSFCSASTNRESNTLRFKTTSFAYANINQYTGKYIWGNWEKSSMLIVVNGSQETITVYSPTIQQYAIIEYEGKHIDNSGGSQLSYKVVDQDGDRGHVRLRREKNGNLQMYVDFADCAWCYNIYQID